MSLFPKILPVVAFGLSLAVTLVFRQDDAVPVSPRPRVTTGQNPEAGRTKNTRDDTSYAAVRALLRDGKTDEARILLQELAMRDPTAFFKLLAKLPTLPGLDDIVRRTAGRLAWNEQAVIDMLNRISDDDLRDLAWDCYITPRAGVLPDEEVFAVGAKANESGFLSALGGLFRDAAEKRPESFFAFLNTTESTSLRSGFFEELMKFHPERASELFKSIPDGAYGSGYDKPYIQMARIDARPTAENLQAVILERGERGVYDQNSGASFVSAAYPKASAAEKAKILDFIAAQPPVARNRLLSGIPFTTVFDFNDPIPPAEFSKVLSLYTSGPMQENGLKLWMERNRELIAKDPGWVETLPSDRLKNYAREMTRKNEKSAEPAEGPPLEKGGVRKP